MTARLTSQILIGVLLRRVQAQGGHGTVLHKGEPLSGTIVVQAVDRGRTIGLFERVTSLDGTLSLTPCGPRDLTQDSEISQYIDRRTRVDPDIWFVELDVADGERLAVEILCTS
ncbi:MULTISPECIES: DUF1491 family protein [Sphingobium]|uniref:DUF1491 family protein n=1 Tax=Sphingobium TaxID=165695 RepID=UPI0015EC0B28|nr:MULTISPECIES: DUF1491 family protein [Sphingobium]MCW2363491.1 hypothetical protein [Sphingobium sp. B10D3B]MCW2403110.1 hypothetical protein [Sphingobium sp. B10D7B]MCW2410089.1 hypothetical protein [Sphingobium xanthum]